MFIMNLPTARPPIFFEPTLLAETSSELGYETPTPSHDGVAVEVRCMRRRAAALSDAGGRWGRAA